MILQNAVEIKEDSHLLWSMSRHHCVIHKTPSGEEFMLDGGNDYMHATDNCIDNAKVLNREISTSSSFNDAKDKALTIFERKVFYIKELSWSILDLLIEQLTEMLQQADSIYIKRVLEMKIMVMKYWRLVKYIEE
jgi:hypothetical protein